MSNSEEIIVEKVRDTSFEFFVEKSAFPQPLINRLILSKLAERFRQLDFSSMQNRFNFIENFVKQFCQSIFSKLQKRSISSNIAAMVIESGFCINSQYLSIFQLADQDAGVTRETNHPQRRAARHRPRKRFPLWRRLLW